MLDLSFFFNFYFYFILLYNTVLVLPYIDMNPARVYMSSQTWNPLPPHSPYHLSGSSPCTSPKHPVSCIKHRLAIRSLHDSIHVSMPFSQIIPPSPSPSESKIPLYTSVSLLLSRIQGGMIWEKGIETCIISYMKQIASPGSMHDTGCLGLVHWDDPERWYGECGRRGVQDWELMYTCGRFMSIYGKTNTVL